MAYAPRIHLMPKPGDAAAYYGRVSTPKQKLEHQREYTDRWLTQEGIRIPKEWYFEDKERRHKSAEREQFQRLLELARTGKIEWIVIASFERWGVADVDEFFDFRRQLKEAGVRLWSVQDHLDLTGCTDADYFRIISLAVAHTMAMAQYAEQNIRKMISMALDGWHASKEHPYGTDLMCYQLSDMKPLFRVHLVSKDLERSGPRIYKIEHHDGRTETVTKMPPRDGKTTGYRLVPSIDKTRIENVKLVFELFAQGLTNREIAYRLKAMGRTYFGKMFGPHAIEAILANPAYIGRPAWGKWATGHYRQVFDKVAHKPTERKRNQPKSFDKGEEHYVYPTKPIFAEDTIISMTLWETVQNKLSKKLKREYSTRRRSKTIHPLNGLLVCPDCGRRMVVNNTTGRKGERINYFICGGYAKSGKAVCRPNSVRFSKVDEAMKLCWERVNKSLKDIASLPTDDRGIERMLKSKHDEVWDTWARIILDVVGQDNYDEIPFDDLHTLPRKEIEELFKLTLVEYKTKHKKEAAKSEQRLATIDKEINRIGDLLEDTPSDTLRKRWFSKLQELEQEKSRLETGSISLADRIRAAAQHSEALSKTLAEGKTLQSAAVWATFVEKIVPVMEDLPFGKKTQRTVTAFQFVPKQSVEDMLGGVLELIPTRKGRGSARQSA